jgi:periplasmic copper chaperone A
MMKRILALSITQERMKAMRTVIQRVALLLIGGVWMGMAQAAGSIMVENAWVREAPPGAAASAGYMTVRNMGDKPRALVGANCADFGSTMLHRTVMQDGMAKMIHQMMIEIPAGGSVTFKPNDFHVMLMKPKHALKAGDKVDITLKFKNGESKKVTYQVRAAEGGMDHGSMGGMKGMGGMDHSKM